jgi:hypothetical protein
MEMNSWVHAPAALHLRKDMFGALADAVMEIRALFSIFQAADNSLH